MAQTAELSTMVQCRMLQLGTRMCVVSLLAFIIGGCGSSSTPDYQALCEKECACEGCVVSSCTAKYQKFAKGQAEHSCRSEGDAVVRCKLSEGGARCERAGGMTLYMPSDKCKPKIDTLAECLRSSPAEPTKSQPVSTDSQKTYE